MPLVSFLWQNVLYFLDAPRIFVWQNVLYFLDAPPTYLSTAPRFLKEHCFCEVPSVSPLVVLIRAKRRWRWVRSRVKWRWQGTSFVLGVKPASLPLCPQQILRGLAGVRTWSCALRGRWLTAWDMASPWTDRTVNLARLDCNKTVNDVVYGLDQNVLYFLTTARYHGKRFKSFDSHATVTKVRHFLRRCWRK